MTYSKLASSFKQAKHFRACTKPRDIRLVILHDEEATESTLTAEHVAAWFAGSTAPIASAHYAVDCDSIVSCVLESDCAYHASSPVNEYSIGIEMAGWARNTEAQWLADMPMLILAAELTADICSRYGIPVTFVDAAGLVAGERGISTHAEVSKAFKKTTHTDPGSGWPMQHFLELVQDCMNGKAG